MSNMVYGGIAGGAIGAAGGYATAAPGQEKMGIFKGAMIGAGIGAIGGAARHGVKWDATNKAMQEKAKREAAAAAANMAKGKNANSWNPFKRIKDAMAARKGGKKSPVKEPPKMSGADQLRQDFNIANAFKSSNASPMPTTPFPRQGNSTTSEAIGDVRSAMGISPTETGLGKGTFVDNIGLPGQRKPQQAMFSKKTGQGMLPGIDPGGMERNDSAFMRDLNTKYAKTKRAEEIAQRGIGVNSSYPPSQDGQRTLFSDDYLRKPNNPLASGPIMSPPGTRSSVDDFADSLYNNEPDRGLFSGFRGLNTGQTAQRRNSAGQFMSMR